jgi:hypothetical protein
MAIIRKIVDPSIVIDNLVIAYVPNSLSFTEGFGAQKVIVQTGGGGAVQQIVADDVKHKLSTVKFKIEPTVDNITNMRAIKANQHGHVITISGQDNLSGETITRTITNALCTSDYTVAFGTDSEIDLEFVGSSAI